MKTYKVDNRYWFDKYYFIEQCIYYRTHVNSPFVEWYLEIYIPMINGDV